MSFIIETAKRQQAKLRIGLAAPSGGGKTYSALKLAYGLVGDWNKIGIIDTEQGSASLYSDLGPFKRILFNPPFSAERYVEAIQAFEDSGIDVIIVDSVTHIWKGEGGLLEYQTSLGGRFQDWAKVTPLYQRFLQTILQSRAHLITTIRKKESYAMINENGRTRVEKQGLDDEIRDGFNYELTVAFDINIKHLAEATKDRTGLFMKKDGSNVGFVINEETGKTLRTWSQGGEPVPVAPKIENKVLGNTNSAVNSQPAVELASYIPPAQKEALFEGVAPKDLGKCEEHGNAWEQHGSFTSHRLPDGTWHNYVSPETKQAMSKAKAKLKKSN